MGADQKLLDEQMENEMENVGGFFLLLCSHSFGDFLCIHEVCTYTI